MESGGDSVSGNETTEATPFSETTVSVISTQPVSGRDVGSDTASLTGTLTLDDEGLAGAEIFLGINPPGTNADFEARYTCTDANGVFIFEQVPADTPLIAIAGGGCDNPLFVDKDTTPEQPLAVTLFINPGETISRDTDIGDISIPRIPEIGGIAAEALAVISQCVIQKRPDLARSHLNNYGRLIVEQEAAGNLSPREVASLNYHALSLSFTLDSGFCEP